MPKTNYVWDHLNDSYLMETDENGDPTVVYTQKPSQYGGVISQERGAEIRYYLADALGSTRTLIDETEAVTDTYEYDAWGNEVASTGVTENPFRWIGLTGYHFDPELAQSYVRMRAFNLTESRWTAFDPEGFVNGPNQMKYCRNLPTASSDPSGLEESGPLPLSMGEFTMSYQSKMDRFRWDKSRLFADVTIDFNPFAACCQCRTIDLVQVVRRTFWRNWEDEREWEDEKRTRNKTYKKGDWYPDSRAGYINKVRYRQWYVDISPENVGRFQAASPFYNDSVLNEFKNPPSRCQSTQVVPWKWGLGNIWIPHARIHDTPSVPIERIGGGKLVFPRLQFEFETCAVCKDKPYCDARGSVFGCVTWGFNAEFDTATKKPVMVFKVPQQSDTPSTVFNQTLSRFRQWACPDPVPIPPPQPFM